MGILVVALAVMGVACGGGDDDHECRTCTVSDDCDGDALCELAVDGQMRCFDPDEDACTIDRVPVGRAPTPLPTP